MMPRSKLRLSAPLAALAVVTISVLAARAQDSKSVATKGVVQLKRAPVNLDVLKVHLPRPVKFKLRNGLTILALERDKLPTVDFVLRLRPGQLADPKDLPGLASFTAEMLREGTARRSSAQIATEVDSLGASLFAGANFGDDATTVRASGLAVDADRVLDLLSDVVLHPVFSTDELEKYKKRQISELKFERSTPSFLAQERFNLAVYGDSPASVASPTPQSIEHVTSANLSAFHQRYYRPEHAVLYVAGAVKAEEIRNLIEKYFGAWPAAAGDVPAALPSLPPLPPAQPKKIYLVDRPESVQTNIIAGDYSIQRGDPDYYALEVMNDVLGGGVAARLFLNLREDKGYTYGAYSGFTAGSYRGAWFSTTEVRNAVTDGSLHELFYEFNRIRNEPVPKDELEEVKRSLIASFALSLESPNAMIRLWQQVQEYGFPEDYWDKYPERIAQVSQGDIQRVAKKYVDLDHLQVVCIGDAKEIKTTLAKYGSVEVYDADGKKIP